MEFRRVLFRSVNEWQQIEKLIECANRRHRIVTSTSAMPFDRRSLPQTNPPQTRNHRQKVQKWTSAFFLVPDSGRRVFQRLRERQQAADPGAPDRDFSRAQFESMTDAIEI